MAGVDAFEQLFGNVTMSDLIMIFMAFGFMYAIYVNIKKFFDKQYQEKINKSEADKERDEKIDKALHAISLYPQYREQSIQIQKELKAEITSLKEAQEATNLRLKQMEEENARIQEFQKTKDRNKLRNDIIKSYQYYMDDSRNPKHCWTRMEHDAFYDFIKDYEARDGNGYVHQIIIPAMDTLKIIEMDGSSED